MNYFSSGAFFRIPTVLRGLIVISLSQDRTPQPERAAAAAGGRSLGDGAWGPADRLPLHLRSAGR